MASYFSNKLVRNLTLRTQSQHINYHEYDVQYLIDIMIYNDKLKLHLLIVYQSSFEIYMYIARPGIAI